MSKERERKKRKLNKFDLLVLTSLDQASFT
jgi:hypothetical protein